MSHLIGPILLSSTSTVTSAASGIRKFLTGLPAVPTSINNAYAFGGGGHRPSLIASDLGISSWGV
ncbi:MAG: hypothetical protein LZ167_05515 [Thaumarchaeota archaeon]|jgi:hypothetical protein|nr:hypothetical protein [Candidatus Geocrenenecus arthurdayi]